jgi:hypothetical protein
MNKWQLPRPYKNKTMHKFHQLTEKNETKCIKKFQTFSLFFIFISFINLAFFSLVLFFERFKNKFNFKFKFFRFLYNSCTCVLKQMKTNKKLNYSTCIFFFHSISFFFFGFCFLGFKVKNSRILNCKFI